MSTIRLDTPTSLGNVTALRVPRGAWPPFWRDQEWHNARPLVEWRVENRGHGWGVFDGWDQGGECLCKNGEWEPNRRNDKEWLDTLGRWPTIESALRAACIAAGLYPNTHWRAEGCSTEDWVAAWERYVAETRRQVSALARRLRVARALEAGRQLGDAPFRKGWSGGWSGVWPEAACHLRPVRCCPRANEYNGYGSDGPLSFVCPRGCPCHD